MMWIKPETGLRLQQIVAQYDSDRDGDGPAVNSKIEEFMEDCPVCRDDSCSKSIVKANGVFVHPEDVDAAAEIERPSLGDE